MAGGWARDGAVSEQIEASISDELARMQAQKRPVGESLTHCAECEEPIPEKRRTGFARCEIVPRLPARAGQGPSSPASGINRRGSKDSQLK